MSKECLGCGSILQSENAKNEGFVKSSVYDKSSYCERCFKIMHYGEYSVLDKKIDYKSEFNVSFSKELNDIVISKKSKVKV